jgi:peptidoglycan/LPS O-acetylase OafA/YrhL
MKNIWCVKWPLRMAIILVLVVGIDAIAVLVADRPQPWAALIPALIPVLTAVFVIVPMMKEARSGANGGKP